MRTMQGVGIVFVLLLILILNGCVEKTTQLNKSDTIKIGFIGPLTGGQAYVGQETKQGMDIALQEINDSNIQVLYEDTQGQQTNAVTAFQKLTQINNVPAIITVISSDVLTIAPLAEEAHVIQLTPIASASKIKDAGDYTFRIREKSEAHGKKLSNYAIKKGFKRIASLVVSSDNGVSYRDSFEKSFKELGGNIVFSEEYKKDTPDFRTELLKIKGENPDAIFIAGFVRDMAEQIKEARQLGLSLPFIASPGIEDKQLFEIAGSSAEGVIFSAPAFNAESTEQGTMSFVKAHQQLTNSTRISWLTANGYDAIKILAAVIQNCATDTACIKTGLYQIKNYPGVGGTITFDSDGEVEKTVILKTVQNGMFVQVENN